jgi:uncharacterized membrane protein
MVFPSHLFALFAVGIILWPIAGGVAGALIAQSKNRSALEGAVLGVFLGWIGIVVEVVLPALPEKGALAPSGGGLFGAPTSTPSLDIINERYARGEISREEFQQLKADLGGY